MGLGGVPMALLVLCDELGWRLRATSFLLASKVVCACVDYDVAWRPQLILGQQLQGKLGVPASEFSHFVFGEELGIAWCSVGCILWTESHPLTQ